MRKFKNILEAFTAILSAGLLVLQAGQSVPLQVSLDPEEAAIVFMLKRDGLPGKNQHFKGYTP